MSLKNSCTTSDHLPYHEYERLLRCLRHDKDYFYEMYARLSFCTALRISDVLNLKWGDILNKTHLSLGEKKTGKWRKITFSPSVQAKIREMHRLMGKPELDRYVFAVSERANMPATIQCVNRNLKKIKYRYGLKVEHFSSHTFRKTFGRYIYESNKRSSESLLLLNRILNHSSLDVTKRYIGITDDEISDVFKQISF